VTDEKPTIAAAAEWALMALLFSLAFMQPSWGVLGSSVVATDLIFLVCALLFTSALVLRKISFRSDRIYIWLGLYAIALGLSAVLSQDTAKSIRRLPAELYLIALPVLVTNIVRDEQVLIRALSVWLWASVLAASVSAFTALSFFAGWENGVTRFAMHHYGTLPPGNYPRIQGTFEYPSMLCNYLTVGVILLLAYRRDRQSTTAWFVVVSVVFVIAIFFTLTPGIGGLLAGMALWFYVAAPAELRAVRKLALVAAGVILVAFVLISSLTPFGTAGPVYFSLAGYDITPTARLLTWQQAWATFVGDPIFGHGLGLPVVDLPYRLPAGGWSLITDAHNVALNVAAQAGIFGVLGLSTIVVMVIRRSRVTAGLRSRADTARVAMGIALVSCLVLQGLAGSFENARHLWLLMGLIIAADRITSPRRTEEPHA
jgi:O-antigen ligase